ncbi:MAG TPA: creatininase family protein, partial [Methylomirabilota bacterium]|nr:creatininase family protein [Methylomirabilota bacterium]
MAIHELADMTWEEVCGLDAARTIAILPVGAIEAHGPHLPLATDVVIALAMARAGASALASRGLGALV